VDRLIDGRERTAVTTAMSSEHENLPHELADRFTGGMARFFKIEVATGVVLLAASALALGLSNSAWGGAYLGFWETPVGFHLGNMEFTRTLRHWINDGLMTLFFFVVALELKRAIVLGELRKPRAAVFSLAGALGGMLFPVGLFLLLMIGQPGIHGWGVVMSTDTAFMIGGIALFGWRLPPSLRLFLVSLAIFDDVGAILVVAVGYSETIHWWALAAAGIGVLAVYVLARVGIRRIPVYIAVGVGVWACIDSSGIHPTIAGVVLGLMTPTRVWVSDARLRAIFGRVLSYPMGEHWSGDTEDRNDLRRAGRAASESLSPVERLEIGLHPWTGFLVMPVFALANAGVVVRNASVLDPLATAIIAALALGKPLGVFTFSWLAVRLGIASRPPGLRWSLLAAGSLLTGIGFTMSLFIAGLAYSPATLERAKIGILTASIVSAVTGLMLLWVTSSQKKEIAKPGKAAA
jgi:NhaA family Na+:H+ antiporter